MIGRWIGWRLKWLLERHTPTEPIIVMDIKTRDGRTESYYVTSVTYEEDLAEAIVLEGKLLEPVAEAEESRSQVAKPE